MINVLFVCMGNICRSPTAQGVFEQLVISEGLSDRIRTDSAGTHAYHIGEKPDARASAAALQRGIDLNTQPVYGICIWQQHTGSSRSLLRGDNRL